MDVMWIIVMGLLGVCVYFLPWIIANNRKHHQNGAIFPVNLLLAWTLLGWGVALVWSLLEVKGPVDERIECPFCAELIKPPAKVCPFCRRDLEDKASA